ncbi:Sulfite exporter TauE/SafE [Micrococcales bacterium KH10]|nr:Sulfite exporter TauE/SafE [Micrococcales bacterium KH10]
MTVTYPVTGMTCASCERRIERSLSKLDGVTAATASNQKGTVQVTSQRPLDPEDIALALIDSGYSLGKPPRKPWLAKDRSIWRDSAIGFGIVLMIVLAFTLLDIDQAASTLTSGRISGGLAGVALLGLTAGFSTCMVTVGGLALSMGARYSARFPAANARARWGIQIAFNVGRIMAFAALGAVLGSVGSAVAISTRMVAALLIIAAVAMALIGIRLTELSPRMARWSPTLPGSWGRRVHATINRWTSGDNADSTRPVRWWAATAALGAATFFLPCAFTQAAQMLAFASGSPAMAAALLAVFALGTAPGLLTVAGVWATRTGIGAARFARIAGVIVVAFALVTSSNALSLWRSVQPSSTTINATKISDNVTVSNGVQVMRMEQNPGGYSPAHSVVHLGTPVRWEITSSGYGCASILIAPQAGIDGELLVPGQTFVAEFTPTTPGTWEYTCSMGMVGGTVTVLPTRVAG